MDTVFKVCDAMENIAFSASTVVPKSFVCGGPTGGAEESSDFVISSCGVVTSKYASRDAEFGFDIDDNSVCVHAGDDKEKVVKDEPQEKEPLHVDVASSDVSEETENTAGMALFGVPLNWPHVVKKTSSWSNGSHKTASTSYSSYSSSTQSSASKSKRDDSMSVPNKSMERELPSFGKSREYRSFGSNKSQGDNSASSLLKPTYMSASQSKQLHEESSRYKYILKRTPSTRSSTVTQPVNNYTTVSAAGDSDEASSNVFETSFLTPFPKLYSS